MRTPYHRHVLAGALLATLLIASTATTCAYSQTVDVAKLTGANTTGAAAQIQTRAKVIGVNVAAHTVTLHGIGGRTFDVTVSPEVGDINKLQIGDTVDIVYRESLLIHADKVKSNGIRERIDTTNVLPASEGVAGSSTTVQVLGTIEKVDLKKRQVTLRGPLQTGTIQVGPDVSLASLKVGDSIRAVYVIATAVKVTRN